MSADATGRTSGRVGVREVAALAGVSTQTVSRVLNDRPGIREETRRRVQEAIAALDYRVNNAARALGTRRSHTLGVVASDATLFGPSAGIAALERAAREAGQWMTTAYADAASPASVAEGVRHLLDQGVDGIIVVAAHARTLETLADLARGVPLAVLHSGPGARAQADGAALAVAHLAGLGHRRVARVGGPGDWLEEAARAEGYARAVAEQGLAEGRAWRGDWSATSGAALAPEVAGAVRAADGPTAVVVANDQMALGLIAGLRAGGIRVPEDVSIVGYDDNPDAAHYRPALTTVRLDVAGEARRCVAEALGLPDAAPPSAPALVPRASSAAPL